MKTNQQPQQPQTTTPIPTKQLSKTGSEKPAWVDPAIKIAAVGVGTVAILLAAGGLFRVLAWTISGWNEFKGTMKK